MNNKIRKVLFIIIFLLLIVLLSGCTTIDEYEEIESSPNNNSNQYKYSYSYEIVDAKITNIDCRHWFAICHHYNWDIEVYCEKYKISYSENGDDSGAFADIPYYFHESKDDIIKLKVRKQYINDKLYKIEAIEIVE